MSIYTTFKCFSIVFLLFFLYNYINIYNSGYKAQVLGLYEGEICRKGDGESSNYICRSNCPASKEEIEKISNITSICSSSDGPNQTVCCPPTNKTVVKTYSAAEMCRAYSELIYKPKSTNDRDNNYTRVEDCYTGVPLNTNGTEAKPKEFPHMALLGFNEKPDNISWRCGGSLISNRFVLTAAHCEKFGYGRSVRFALWARLGDLDYLSDADDARPHDYRIVERIIHPKRKLPSLYHDIALFRLERDVDFSAYVRPICLNTDQSSRPPVVIGTGWGQIDMSGHTSNKLLQISLDTIPAEECDKKYLYMTFRKKKLSQGIVDYSMVCANNEKYEKASCSGNSGGPIHIKHDSYTCMYSQIGITSFSGQYCGNEDSPSVYTRVLNYVSWIEPIVWPKM